MSLALHSLQRCVRTVSSNDFPIVHCAEVQKQQKIIAMKEKQNQNYIIFITYSNVLVSMTKLAETILNYIKF